MHTSDSTSEEFLHQFKSVMPPAVKTTLAGRKFENIEAYADAADNVDETTQECTNIYMVGHPSKVDTSGLCFYHTHFDNKAQSAGPHASSKLRETSCLKKNFQQIYQSCDRQMLLDHSVYVVDNGDKAIPSSTSQTDILAHVF